MDENAWNEDQQEPSKKVKSEEVALQIDLADFAESPVALNDKVDNISHVDGGHQNGQDESGHQNGQGEGGHQNGHNGDVRKNGHPVEAEANVLKNIENELDQLYEDYGYGAAVEPTDTQPKLAELKETPNAEELVELRQVEKTDDVPDCGDQNLKTVEPQQNLSQEDETEDEPMELKITEEADDLDSTDEEVLLLIYIN